MKRLVIVSDLHCGSRVGLTPPGFQGCPGQDRYHALQREIWGWYEQTLAKLQPIDVLLCNGDAIDGRGSRSGGTELITSDLKTQVEIAHACLRQANAGRYCLTYGTPYHVGPEGEDWELILAEKLGGSIGGHEWLDINGLVIDCKHKVGSSSVPWGRATAVAKEHVWNLLWSERDFAPKSRIIIRSHVHYFGYVGNHDFLAITTPALQGPGSKFGIRQCSGTVDCGLIEILISDTGEYKWRPHLLRLQSKPEPVKL